MDEDFSDGDDIFDTSALAEVERAEAAVKQNPALARAPSLPANAINSMRLQQKDLFGNNVVAKAKAPVNKTAPWQSGTTTTVTGNTSNAVARPSTSARPFTTMPINDKVNAVARKKWDRTMHVKSGVATKSKGVAGKGKNKNGSKGKGKARAYNDDVDEEEEDMYDVDEDDPLYDPEEALPPPKPMKLLPDREACKTFVYPLNKPLRKYQYDIVTKAFYTDTLVALPTGLGKTFLAAVVMLNFYRWFPKGKIIFMAPSRPLVTQQIAACHGIAGIPLKDAVELTGKDSPEKREQEWERRRVFYCTPQTVRNDLIKKKLDPSDIICIVADEAHRATGDYAYAEVIRYMMQRNPHFRLLALTATPGGNAEVVQSVIDNLHIGHIEVRTDESLDIRQYIHKKKVDLITIPIIGEICSIRDRYIVLMDMLVEPVKKAGLLRTNKTDPTTIHPYAFQTAGQQAIKNKAMWAFAQLNFLASMARCVAKLLEQSVTAFNESLKELRGTAKGKAVSVINHPNFATILRDTEDIVNGREFEGHPKMIKLRELITAHFEQTRSEGTLDQTRIMVFCSFREVVDEIVERLNKCDGIRATRLVGQGTDTKGKKGLAQKQQNEVLANFKKGTYNVLVATSIGEEGLDIGELDLIICYEASKSPIRTLQRAGRTGRARDGRIIVLMTEGIEEMNWHKANEDYKGVQNAIVSGKQFELYADCQRLVPADIRPVPDKRLIEVEPFDPDKMGVGQGRAATGKRKRDEEDNIDDFESGFQNGNGKKMGVTASKVKTKSRSAPMTAEEREMLLDLELEDDGLLQPDEKAQLKKSARKPTIERAQAFKAGLASLPSLKRSFSTLASEKSGAPQRLPKFGTSRKASLFSVFEKGREMSADSKAYRKWEDSTYPAFKNSNVEWWAEGKAGKGRDSSFRPLTRNSILPLRSSAKAPPSTFAKSRGTDISVKNDIGMLSDGDDGNASMSSEDLPEISSHASDQSGKAKLVDKTMDNDDSDVEEVASTPPLPRLSRNSGQSRPGKSNLTKPARNPRGLIPSPQRRAAAAPVVIELDDDDGEDERVAPAAKLPAIANTLRPVTNRPCADGAAEPTEKVQVKPSAPPSSDAYFDDGFEMDVSGVAANAGGNPASRAPCIEKAGISEMIPPSSPGELAIAAIRSSAEQMPPPRMPRVVASLKRTREVPAGSPAVDSPIVVRRRGAPHRRVIADDESSSPDKRCALPDRRPQAQKADQSIISVLDDSVVPISPPARKIRKLVRAGQAIDVPSDGEVGKNAGNGRSRASGLGTKNNKGEKKRKKLPGDQCPFFDMRAINSDDPDSETCSEDDGDPETTRDRQFVDSDDISNPNDMSAFYRESLMSQAAHRFHGSVKKPGAYKMRVDAGKRYVAPRRDEEQPEASQWSFGSFVVEDDEDIEYEDGDDGLPDEEEALTSEAG